MYILNFHSLFFEENHVANDVCFAFKINISFSSALRHESIASNAFSLSHSLLVEKSSISRLKLVYLCIETYLFFIGIIVFFFCFFGHMKSIFFFGKKFRIQRLIFIIFKNWRREGGGKLDFGRKYKAMIVDKFLSLYKNDSSDQACCISWRKKKVGSGQYNSNYLGRDTIIAKNNTQWINSLN